MVMTTMIAKTTIPFAVVTLSILSILLLSLSVGKEDWIVEEIEVKLTLVSEKIKADPQVAFQLADILNNGDLNEALKKISLDMGSDTKEITSNSFDSNEKPSKEKYTGELVKEILRSFTDGSIFIQGLYGFDKTCIKIELAGLKTPIRWMNSLYLQFCMDNDLFFNPTEYDLPETVKMFQDKGLKGLKNGYIIALIGIALASLGLLAAIARTPCVNIEYKTQLLFVSMTFFIMSVICVGCTLVVVRSDFNLKESYENAIALYQQQNDYSNNDDLQTNKYLEGSSDNSDILKMMQEFLHWEEYLGSPAALCGISMTVLLVSTTLCMIEYRLTKTNDVKYDNVALV